MPFITITLSTQAHALLKSHKEAGESFSDVVERVVPPPPAATGAEILERSKEFIGKPLIDPERMKMVREGRKRRSNRHAARH